MKSKQTHVVCWLSALNRLLVILMALMTVGFGLHEPVYAQNTSLYFNHLTRDDGLLSNRVNYILEDSLGFIWFATEEGLEKFDGYGFETYADFLANNNTTPDNAVNFILEDTKKPNLWIATHQGLVYFDRYKDKFKLVLSDEFKNRPSETINITSLCFDHADNLWIGTLNGLFIWNTRTQILTRLISGNQGSYSRIFTLFTDNQGVVWVGSDKGIYKYIKAKKQLQHCYTAISFVRVIKQDSKGNFWIGTDNAGLYRVDGLSNNGFKQHFSKENGSFVSNRISGVIEDKPGIYFILVRDGGLYRYDDDNNRLTFYPYDLHNPNGINSTALITSFKSSQNIIWIGTYNSGVNYLDRAQKQFMLYRVNFKKDGLLNNNIRALAEDSQGYIWIGTKEGGGLSRFDKEKGTFKNYAKTNEENKLRDDYIFSLFEMDSKRLLVGTFREGLAVFNKKKEIFKYYTHIDGDKHSLSDNRVYTIFKDSEKTIWIGNYYNLQIFKPGNGSFETIDDVKRPRCICEENGNKIWVGTKDNGIYLVDKQKKVEKHILNITSDTNSISSNDIYALVKDQHNNLWIGTKRGLNKLNIKNNTITRYTQKEGLPANWIRGILVDDKGNVWASTTNGITRFDVKHGVFHNYDVKDRLQGNEFERYVALKTHDSYMLFGGHNGFNIFKPEDIIDNKIIPPVYITGISLLNEKVSVGAGNSPLNENILFAKHLTLNYNQPVVTINYAALNYTSPEKNQYAYKLDGFVQDWVFTGNNRSAVFTNIPPGDYTFHVIGSNNDGYWNKKGASIEITILPPPWKTVWAYIIYSVLLVLIVLLIRRIMIVRIEQKKLLEFERMDKKRIQEINQSKLRFFTNISHEFRTPLTLISSPLNKLLESENYTEEQSYLFRLINNNVKRLLILVNELMDFRKTEYGQYKLNVSHNDLVEEIEESIECFFEKAGEKGIDLSFEHPEKPVSAWFDKNIIDKVLFNLLSNAVKYTQKEGNINLRLVVKENRKALVSINNSGKGIPEDKIVNIFDRFFQVEEEHQPDTGTGIGLAFSKRLIETHKGSITAHSIPGELTTFTIEFPVYKEAYQDEERTQANIPEPKKRTIKLESVEPGLAKEKPVATEKLLIVEDNDELRNYLKTVFSAYSLLVAANGKEGVRLAIENVPDIIVSDVIMPELDGIELCSTVKSNLITSHIPVILLTAKADIQHKIKGIETGADAYIEKPFNTDFLLAMVKNMLLQRKKVREKFSDNPGYDINEAGINKSDKQFIEKIRTVIEANISSPDFSVEKLSTELGVSRSQLFRKFKALFNLKPNELIRVERLKYAKKLLQQNEYNVNEVAIKAGFASTSYFITSFKKYFGETPSHYLH